MAPGGGLTLDVLDRCRRQYQLSDYTGQPCYMGVDVGTKLHVVVRQVTSAKTSSSPNPVPRPSPLWFAGEVDTFAELHALMTRFHVQGSVIDALPETRLATQFADQYREVRLAYYDRHDVGHELDSSRRTRVVHANRLQLLDETMARFHEGCAELPANARLLSGRLRDGIGEYYREILVPQRTLERDRDGNWVARWLDNGRADHFAHAEAYCWLAEYAAIHGRPNVRFFNRG